MVETRRRVSRNRKVEDSLRKEWKPRQKTDASSASFSGRLVGFLHKTFMRGLFDDSDDESSEAQISTASRTGRFLDEPHTSEDVLANEGDGSHIPFLYPHRRGSKEKPKQTFSIEGPVEEKKSTVRGLESIDKYLFL